MYIYNDQPLYLVMLGSVYAYVFQKKSNRFDPDPETWEVHLCVKPVVEWQREREILTVT